MVSLRHSTNRQESPAIPLPNLRKTCLEDALFEALIHLYTGQVTWRVRGMLSSIPSSPAVKQPSRLFT